MLIVTYDNLINDSVLEELGLVYGIGNTLESAKENMVLNAKRVKEDKEEEMELDVDDKFAIVGYRTSILPKNTIHCYGTLIKTT